MDPWGYGNDGEPLDMLGAVELLAEPGKRRVAEGYAHTPAGTLFVSTYNVVITRSSSSPPRHYETMAFRGLGNGVILARYSSWEEAEEGHAKIMEDLESGGIVIE